MRSGSGFESQGDPAPQSRAQPPGSKELIAASHLVLGSQGVEAEVGSREVPLPAHFHPS